MSSSLIALSILALALMLHTAYAAEAEAHHVILKHEEYPGKCVIHSSNGKLVVINSDETIRYPGKCAEVYCGRNSWALIYTCPKEYPPTDCVFGDYVDINAPYPDCCPRHIDCNSIDSNY
ncbi:PREDICTED: uncharacterized protein LOC108620300 [Drosophila arizonae]|uniref:Uncharacterized protein LOC108620300 n=1 Tax=Drosophila arizonae TaxID=7263 RepID=A0ABM1PZQ8_DROAR|nr:PREDICTED: uncharacterized protein LOC108620300 [Drosophila arizonae]